MDTADQLYLVFGQYIKSARVQRHLTQEGLAAQVGLTRTSINNIEHGRQRIQIHTLFALADALQTRPAALLPRAVSPNTSQVDQRLEELLAGVTDTYQDEERAWIRSVLVDEGSEGNTDGEPDGELDRKEGANPSTG